MSYNKNTWQDSDYITTSDMNKIENGLKYVANKAGSSYVKTVWKNGDIVSADKLNNIEDGIEGIFNAIDLISTEAVLNDITPIDDSISITVNNNGKISATYRSNENLNIINTPGVVNQNTTAHTDIYKNETYQLNIQKSSSIIPTKSQQVAVSSGKFTTGDVVIEAIPNQYIVPSGKKSITQNGTNIDVTEYEKVDVQIPSDVENQDKVVTPTDSVQEITADSGYSGLGTVTVNAVPLGTAGTPIVNCNISNHSATITPSVTNTEGYINSGTKTGDSVSVSASELVSGNKSINRNGTNIDVTNYATVDVDVFSPTLEPLRVYSDNNHNDNDTIITPQTGHAFSSVKVGLDVLNFKLDTSETTLTEDSTSITFNNVFKEPFWYYIVCEDQTQFSSTNKYAFLVYKYETFSNPCISYINSTTKTAYTYGASQSFNYVDSTFTITSTQSGVKFAANKKYTLVCMYNTRMYSAQSSKKEIDSSSNEFEINYLAQRPYAIYGYTNDGDTKQSSSEITSFFALIHDDYEDYINHPTNSCDGSYIITTGQLVECTSADLSIKINRDEEYGTYNYNHSITISSSNFDFKPGNWSIFYIPHNGSPGELISPEPYRIDNSYGEGFTENGVYYAENYGYHGFNRIKINVPQKINYEEGIYTPQSDETNPIIYFSSDHSFPPNQIIMVDTKKYDPEDEIYTPIMPKTNSNIEWGFTYYGWLGGDTSTSPSVQYGSNEGDVILATVRKTSIQSNNTYNQTSYSLTATGLDDWNDATNDYADGTKFMPHTTSSNTVWESGRSYYWLALWAPPMAVV